MDRKIRHPLIQTCAVQHYTYQYIILPLHKPVAGLLQQHPVTSHGTATAVS